ncbi:uncharacterized protein LOC135193642 [Vanessa tameamea]|uniref:Uncharacterized protein LOC135193642 n=1 Tax=Vanessa tameamea TaxID=334116 RepID=A0ABM4AP66_VANTA
MFVMNVYIMILFICDTLAYYKSGPELISPNVGTVLFTQSDLKKKHWSKDKIKLLQARKHIQGLIPYPYTFGTINEDYLNMLLTYFKESFRTVKREIKNSEINNMMNMALSDAIGGYFKVWVLPITKFAYYGGTISMDKTINVFKVYEDIKRNLNTDGHSWRNPNENLLKSVEINVLPRPRKTLTRSMENLCKHLAYYEKTDTDFSIPLPVINWDIIPITIFVPLKNQSLVPISSPNSSMILFNYYDIAENCTQAQSSASSDHFKRKFQTWLSNDVAPHLNDDNLYLAFGSILSLMNDTNKFCGKTKLYNSENERVKSETLSGIKSSLQESPKKYLIIAIILFVELIWCIPSLFYVFCYNKRQGGIKDNILRFFKKKRGPYKIFSYYTQNRKHESNFLDKNKPENGVQLFIKPRQKKLKSDIQYPSSKTKYVSVKSSKSYCKGMVIEQTMANTFPKKSSLKKILPELTSIETGFSNKNYSKPNDIQKLSKVTRKSEATKRDLEGTRTLTLSQDERTIKEINYSQESTFKQSISQCKCRCIVRSSKNLLNHCSCTSCEKRRKDIIVTDNIDQSKSSNVNPEIKSTLEKVKRKEKKELYQAIMHTQLDEKTYKVISDKDEIKKDSNRTPKLKNKKPLLRIRIERPRTEIKVGISSFREHLISKPSKIPRLAVRRETKRSRLIENKAATSLQNTDRSKVTKIILRKTNLKDTLDDTAIKRTSTIDKKLNLTV